MKAAILLIYVGTDDIGRDILSRIIYGTRISVFAGFHYCDFYLAF